MGASVAGVVGVAVGHAEDAAGGVEVAGGALAESSSPQSTVATAKDAGDADFTMYPKVNESPAAMLAT